MKSCWSNHESFTFVTENLHLIIMNLSSSELEEMTIKNKSRNVLLANSSSRTLRKWSIAHFAVIVIVKTAPRRPESIQISLLTTKLGRRLKEVQSANYVIANFSSKTLCNQLPRRSKYKIFLLKLSARILISKWMKLRLKLIQIIRKKTTWWIW